VNITISLSSSLCYTHGLNCGESSISSGLYLLTALLLIVETHWMLASLDCLALYIYILMSNQKPSINVTPGVAAHF